MVSMRRDKSHPENITLAGLFACVAHIKQCRTLPRYWSHLGLDTLCSWSWLGFCFLLSWVQHPFTPLRISVVNITRLLTNIWSTDKYKEVVCAARRLTLLRWEAKQIYLKVVCCLHPPPMTQCELAVALVRSLLQMTVATLHKYFSDARHPKSLNIYLPVSSFFFTLSYIS